MLCQLTQGSPQAILIRKRDGDHSGFDIRHNLVAKDTCELPFDHGWA
jgi:hypothetical protein